MNILISGAGGLIGGLLVKRLQAGGHTMTRLSRGERGGPGRNVTWDQETGRLDTTDVNGFDAVIHLAGENIASRRWSADQKARIRNSRVLGTALLAERLTQCDRSPSVFVCASATGYYGDRGDEWLHENSGCGKGFLADVCVEWEAACQPVIDHGVRTVTLRTGIVLSTEGGALAKMLLPLKLGLGGRLGNGRQWWSWISVEDEVAAIEHALFTESLVGPVNLVAPEPVTNTEFTRTLGRVLNRPTALPAPSFLLRMALGEMADSLLLSSARVSCGKLRDSGFVFKYAALEPTLRDLL